MSNLFQDSKTGALVEFITKHDNEFAMVRQANGGIVATRQHHAIQQIQHSEVYQSENLRTDCQGS